MTEGTGQTKGASHLLALLTPEVINTYFQLIGSNYKVLKISPIGMRISQDEPHVVGRFVELNRHISGQRFGKMFPEQAAEGYNNILLCTPDILVVRYTT